MLNSQHWKLSKTIKDTRLNVRYFKTEIHLKNNLYNWEVQLYLFGRRRFTL